MRSPWVGTDLGTWAKQQGSKCGWNLVGKGEMARDDVRGGHHHSKAFGGEAGDSVGVSEAGERLQRQMTWFVLGGQLCFLDRNPIGGAQGGKQGCQSESSGRAPGGSKKPLHLPVTEAPSTKQIEHPLREHVSRVSAYLGR